MKKLQTFGGNWTEKKLGCLKSYLDTYMVALSKNPFYKIYIDVFSGTGKRYESINSAISKEGPIELTQNQKKFFEGSAEIALNINPRFDEYHFIEKDLDKCRELNELILSKNASDISNIHQEDANTAVYGICKNWGKKVEGKWGSRGVIFLDPFGCQAEWKTIKAIAETQALDMWYLFPSGIGALRLMTKYRSKMPKGWNDRLNLILGTEEWEKEFYKENPQANLFGDEEKIRHGGIKEIENFVIKRLRTIFPHVSNKTIPLRNSQNSQMYSLCFAAANPKGGKLAVEIANDLIKKF